MTRLLIKPRLMGGVRSCAPLLENELRQAKNLPILIVSVSKDRLVTLVGPIGESTSHERMILMQDSWEYAHHIA